MPVSRDTFGANIHFMSSNKINPSSGDSKTKRTRSRDTRKVINPDKLLSDINQQTEALNKIIRKFGEQDNLEEDSRISKKKNKTKNK